jgi:hypothetical protein
MRRVDHIGSRNLQVSLRNGDIVAVRPRAADELQSYAIFGIEVCGSAFVYRVTVEEFVRFSERGSSRAGCIIRIGGMDVKRWEG